MAGYDRRDLKTCPIIKYNSSVLSVHNKINSLRIQFLWSFVGEKHPTEICIYHCCDLAVDLDTKCKHCGSLWCNLWNAAATRRSWDEGGQYKDYLFLHVSLKYCINGQTHPQTSTSNFKISSMLPGLETLPLYLFSSVRTITYPKQQ